jgi:hypothetical protein
VPFDPGQFFAIAETIASRAQSEAALRTAVGRAYYSVFLRARQALNVPGSRNVHNRVIAEVRRLDRPSEDSLGKLEELRIRADYDLDVEDPFFTDWEANWRKAKGFANFVMRRIP